jgi:type IV pilus assembly protein PilW
MILLPKNTRSSSHGFTLIELMVGIAISLVMLLVMGGVLSNANRQSTTTTSGADAQITGAIGAHIVERDLRMAGYGMNIAALLGCEVYAYDKLSSGATARYFVFNASPVTIMSGNTTVTSVNPFGLPDSLTVTYGTSDVGFSASKLTAASTGIDEANFKVSNRFGFHKGDVILVAGTTDAYSPDSTTKQPTAGTNGITDCALAQVTDVPTTSGLTDNIAHTSGSYTDASGNTAFARYNKPSGIGIPFTTSATVYNMGPTPVSVTYAISNKAELTRLDNADNGTAQPVAENIVMLRAFYGKDTNADGTVDTWDQNTPTTGVLWKQVLAVQFAVVAQSQIKENSAVTTSPLKLWDSGNSPTTNVPAITLSSEQQKYRYKVFHSLVPLRNMIWSGT